MSLHRYGKKGLGVNQTNSIGKTDHGDVGEHSVSKYHLLDDNDGVSDAPNYGRNNVIAMPGVSSFQSELVILEPYSFQDVPAALLALRDRKVVVLNLSHLDAEEAQRAVDYVAGGTFVLDGHQERIGKCVFLFTPHSVHITSQATAMVANTVNPGYSSSPGPYSSISNKDQEMLRKLKIRGRRPPLTPN